MSLTKPSAPDKILCLPAMRYYAGNWGANIEIARWPAATRQAR